MDDHEFDQHDQEFEAEITDLDEHDGSDGKVSAPRRAWLARSRRLSPRRRRMLLLLCNSVLLLAMVFVLFLTLQTSGVLGNVLLGPTPTPAKPLYPGVDLFYVSADLPWGQLLIDGHATPFPRIDIDPPLRLARGKHVLTWRATPFPPQSCTVSVPPQFMNDTCSDHQAIRVSARDANLSAWLLSFSASLTNLSAQQRTQLVQAAQAALDAWQSSALVRVGESYVLAANDPACQSYRQEYQFQCYATARQPLQATLRLQLDTNPNSQQACIDPQPVPTCGWDSHNCHLFCASAVQAKTTSPVWDVFATVLPLWTFTTLDGHVLEHDVPDNSSYDFATGTTLDETLVELRITWDRQGWHVALTPSLESQPQIPSGFFNPVCAAATQQVPSLVPPTDANGVPMHMQWQYLSNTLTTSGCLAVGAPQSETGSLVPTPAHTAPPFTYLWRFGVLLALSPSADTRQMQLPLADSYEQQVAQGILAHPSGTSS